MLELSGSLFTRIDIMGENHMRNRIHGICFNRIADISFHLDSMCANNRNTVFFLFSMERNFSSGLVYWINKLWLGC